jgi:hypothetical protein
MPLVDFYKKSLSVSKEKGFLWSVFMLSRKADTEEIYKDVMRYWTSLNDITGKTILFVFSCDGYNKISTLQKNLSSLYINPFIVTSMDFDEENYRDSFDIKYYNNLPVKSLADLHSQSIADMVKYLGISEKDVQA